MARISRAEKGRRERARQARRDALEELDVVFKDQLDRLRKAPRPSLANRSMGAMPTIYQLGNAVVYDDSTLLIPTRRI